MDPGFKFLAIEACVAAAALVALFVLVNIVFYIERHTAGPVFSHKGLKERDFAKIAKVMEPEEAVVVSPHPTPIPVAA